MYCLIILFMVKIDDFTNDLNGSFVLFMYN